MIKKGISIFSILLLTACTSTLTSSGNQNFTINNEPWQVNIPEDWQILPLQAGVLFMAQNRDQNFVVLERQAVQENIKDQILASAERDFFFYELVEESENRWVFKGQVRAALPTRTFEQKIYSKGRSFLLGSCSYEVSKTQKSDCEKIIDSWEPTPAES